MQLLISDCSHYLFYYQKHRNRPISSNHQLINLSSNKPPWPCLKTWTNHIMRSKRIDIHHHSPNSRPWNHHYKLLFRKIQNLSVKIIIIRNYSVFFITPKTINMHSFSNKILNRLSYNFSKALKEPFMRIVNVLTLRIPPQFIDSNKSCPKLTITH